MLKHVAIIKEVDPKKGNKPKYTSSPFLNKLPEAENWLKNELEKYHYSIVNPTKINTGEHYILTTIISYDNKKSTNVEMFLRDLN